MRVAAAGLLMGLLGCAGTPRRPPLMGPGALDAATLQGRWHVLATTLPMWIEGDRREPTFDYTNLRREGGRVRFDDTVGFVRDGARGTIEGVDTQHPEVPTHFTWRGKGWLVFFTSGWDVVAVDPGGRWAVITFESTLATPAGMDIISRRSSLDAATLTEAVGVLRGDPVLVPFLDPLVTLSARR